MRGPRVTWTECLLVGLFVFGLGGTSGLLILIAGLVLLIRPGTSASEAFQFDPGVTAFAAASATLAGVLAWRLAVATHGSRPWRGALAGLVVGFVSHPLCWFLLLAYQTAREPAVRSQSPYDILWGQLFMTLWLSVSSLGLVGWMSMPLGAALGYLTRRFQGTPDSRPQPPALTCL